MFSAKNHEKDFGGLILQAFVLRLRGYLLVLGVVLFFGGLALGFAYAGRLWVDLVAWGCVMLLLGLCIPDALKWFNSHFERQGKSDSLLESQATAFVDTKDEAGKRISCPIGKGLLVLRGDKVVFMKKKLLGGYQQEPDHAYYISSILNLKSYSDGLDVEAHYPATEDEPAEVTTVFYELNEDDANRWYETLQSMKTKKEPEPATSQPTPTQQQPVTREIIREKEIIREIVKVRCRNCGHLYDERDNKCPNCGGR